MRRLAGVFLLALPAMAMGQPSASNGRTDPLLAKRVVESLARTIEENYVVPDTGRMIAEHLRARLKDGAYAGVMGMAQFANRLGADAKAINGDLHLYVNFTGALDAQAAAQNGPRIVMRRPGDAPPPTQVSPQARRSNFNMRSVERLAGNVGYFSIDQLSTYGNDEAFRVIDAAMAFLDRADAMIIDLRRTPGGEPRMADYVASYFFGPDTVRTLTSYSRALGQTFERWTTPVRGQARPNIPLFVLVGRGTASGAEDLAFILKQTGRAKLVGERTAGAGRPTRIYPIGDGFVASVPGGRTFDQRTGKEWERVGIQPDIAVDPDIALTTAHAAALERLAAAEADSSWKRSLLWARESVIARANPKSIAPGRLRRFAGEYDLLRITYEEGKLWYQRDATRPKEELTPVDNRTFALGEASRIEFIGDGSRVTAMRLTNPTGPPSEFPRTR
jgi:hypothetical protein